MTCTYDQLLRLLNDMTYDQFEPKPWTHYCNLHSPYGSFWYIGERLAHQGCYDILVVPYDPPACLFVQTDDPVVRGQFVERQSVDLLRFGLDYAEFTGSGFARAHIFSLDPDMVHQPDDFPTSVKYEVRGVRRTLALFQTTTMVEDDGMEGWVHRVRKVMGSVHKKLWRTANRWREVTAVQAASLCQCQEDMAALHAENAELRHYRDTHR